MTTSIYRRLLTLLIGTAILSTMGCKKVLEQEPKNSTYNEVFWQSSRDALSAISGNYSLVRDALTDYNNRYYLYGDAVAKNYYTIQYTGDGLEGIQNGDYTFQYNVNSLGNWSKFYKAIAMSNIVLARVPNIDNEKLTDVDDALSFKNKILGQAYFLRALTYFNMVRVWGDVPLVTEAYEDPISAPRLPRAPKIEIMAQIENDCHSAAALLKWGYTSSADANVIANKGSAYALLAHLYMWRATMVDVSTDAPNMTDLNSADTTINAIVSLGGYSLTDTSNYYSTFIGRSAEGIFELNMSENTLEGTNAGIGLYFLRDDVLPYFPTDPKPRNFVAAGYFSTHFGSYDIRFEKNFDYVNQEKPVVRKYSNIIFRNPGLRTDAYLSNNMILFRLSDMLLLQAEIKIHKNDLDGAAEIINSFRTRNGNSDDMLIPIPTTGYTQEDVMYEYILERGKELYLEGHIFFDLLRTRMYKYQVDWLEDEDVRFKKEGFYWPVDPRLFRDNSFLKQTTYWVGKI